MKDNGEKRALIVVDMQNDFLIGSLCIKNGPAHEDPLEIVEPLNKLIKNRSLSDNCKNSKCFDDVLFIKPFECKQVVFPKHCICDTPGAEIYEDIIVPENSIVVKKGTDTFHDSYSGFFDNLKINKTELEDRLKENNIESVFVCGVALEYCVSSTANDASDLGFKTYFITDCTRGLNFDDMIKAKDEMKRHGVIEITSKEISSI
uniref:nicotinamidase n=1 Tax=Strongyloides papillosus TaxID=174720 RepID=A0A0N5CFS6_STREA